MAEGASSGLSGLTLASYVVGFGKSLGQKIAAARNLGVFGKDVLNLSYHYAGKSYLAFEASVSSLKANRSAIEATGGVFVESIEGIRRSLKNGQLSQFTFRADLFRYESSLDEVTELAKSLRSTGSLIQEGFYQARTSVFFSELEVVKNIGRVARFSKFTILVAGTGIDIILGGGFQYLDDLSNPYLTSDKRLYRAGWAAGGGAVFGLLGAAIAETLICGPAAPLCIFGGGVVGGLIWSFYGQPLVFGFYGLNPERNLRELE